MRNSNLVLMIAVVLIFFLGSSRTGSICYRRLDLPHLDSGGMDKGISDLGSLDSPTQSARGPW